MHIPLSGVIRNKTDPHLDQAFDQTVNGMPDRFLVMVSGWMPNSLPLYALLIKLRKIDDMI
jgi:hypothetical protein